MRERTFYLMDQAPDGSVEILRYIETEMAALFSEEQRALLAAGERVIHHCGRHPGAINHVVVDMAVAAREKLAA